MTMLCLNQSLRSDKSSSNVNCQATLDGRITQWSQHIQQQDAENNPQSFDDA